MNIHTLSSSYDWSESKKSWVADNLPQLNRRALQNDLGFADMATLLNHQVLSDAPHAEETADRDVVGILLTLGLIGSSVERHAQQQKMAQTLKDGRTSYASRMKEIKPSEGLSTLLVQDSIPFADYFQGMADKIGHPHRDSFMTLIEYNGPGVEVRHPRTRQVIYRLSAAFKDSRFSTFSGTETEHNFFRLVKETFALQTGANQYIEQVQAPENSLDSKEAVDAALTATQLMLAIKAQMLDFMKYKAFDIDFFLDEFRQYQCLWYADRYLKPPSAANDTAALYRDLMLFENLVEPYEYFPGFRAHATDICSVLLPHDAQMLQSAMALPSIERKILNTLGMEKADLKGVNAGSAVALLKKHPWLTAYSQLFNAQRDVSSTHFALVLKFLVRPQQQRAINQDDRNNVTIVDNDQGVTGMDPNDILVRLNEARKHHLLTWMNSITNVKHLAKSFLQHWEYKMLSHQEHMSLSRFI
ncbi:MAG: hypothetical protein AAF702_24635 [Chloroflexota bacterium]